nr:unnamed protein product [Digitaria exilis]
MTWTGQGRNNQCKLQRGKDCVARVTSYGARRLDLANERRLVRDDVAGGLLSAVAVPAGWEARKATTSKELSRPMTVAAAGARGDAPSRQTATSACCDAGMAAAAKESGAEAGTPRSGGLPAVMSRSGTGMSMFSMGLFMAQQERIIACGPGLAGLGMALRFVAGPVATLVGAAVFDLRGDVLRVAIIQLPQPELGGICVLLL